MQSGMKPVEPQDPAIRELFSELARDPEGFARWTTAQADAAMQAARAQNVKYKNYFAWVYSGANSGSGEKL